MGRRGEIEKVYRKHGAELVLFAASLLRDRSAAQDVVHQLFLNMLDRSVPIPRQPRAYLYRAVRNAVLNVLKAGARKTELTEESWFVVPGASREEELSLRSALGELAQEQRELVVMHVWGGLTFAEIAGVLDISINTASSRYRYALTNLRERMTRKTDVRI
jgi:RNA polymerase sigma-70 factor (ECF subfamily)